MTWQRLKRQVFKRDGYRCQIIRKKLVLFIPMRLRCRRRLYLNKRERPWYWWVPLPGLRRYPGHLDHIMPKARGGERIFGKWNPDNYQAACARCNRFKSDKLLPEWPLEKRYVFYSLIQWIALFLIYWEVFK